MNPMPRKPLTLVSYLLAFAAVFALGWWLAPGGGGGGQGGGHGAGAGAGRTAQSETAVWTCPMHPQIRQPDPGSCPICGMDLVPADQGGGSDAGTAGPRQLAMSPADAALLEIETAVVQRRYVTKQVRLTGKVDYDETRVRTISAWV